MKTPEEHFYDLIHDLAICHLTERIGIEILDLPDPGNVQTEYRKKQMMTALTMIEGGPTEENKAKLEKIIFDYAAMLVNRLPSFPHVDSRKD